MINILAAIYFTGAVLIGIFTCGQVVILLAYLRYGRRVTPFPTVKESELPKVAVQLPIYNEKHVVERLLDAAAALDYPRDRLTIQVLDDSTDDTVMLVAERVSLLRLSGLNIHHIRRPTREGYKAGALKYGCELLKAEGVEFIGVIDADFVPPSDFLRKTIPYMVVDKSLAIVQARWGHLNDEDNLLTLAQSLSLDAYFVIEQTARNRSGLLLTFNGTGGIWRAAAIEDAGGWTSDTLTEDFDLSYRAQMKGWRYLYLPDLVVPGEVPPQINAYKRQQFRWGKGSTQVLFKLIGPVWRTPGLSLLQRVMSTYHLCQYLPHPVMLTLLLLTPPLIAFDGLDNMPLAPLGVISLMTPVLHLIAQYKLYKNWYQRILAFPMVMILGTGLAWNNFCADLSAVRSVITGNPGEFVRTPKFARLGKKSQYKVSGDWSVWVEVALALYAVFGMVLAWQMNRAMLPILGLYAASFAVVAAMQFRDRWQTTVPTAQPQTETVMEEPETEIEVL